MKSKKSMNLMIGVLIAIATAVVLLSIMKVISDGSKDASKDALCKTALYSSQISQDSLLVNCQTNVITIDQEMLNKINLDKYFQLHERLNNEYYNSDKKNGDINKNEFKVNKIIADEMANLWSIVSEGKLKPFNKLTMELFDLRNDAVKYCYVRSFIRFRKLNDRSLFDDNKIDYSFPEDGSLNKNSLVYFMNYNPVSTNNDQSYYNYLKDEDSPIANYLSVVVPIINETGEDQISESEEYYIIYRKTYINNKGVLSGSVFAGLATALVGGLSNNKIIKTALKIGGSAIAVEGLYSNIKDRLTEEGIDEIILISSDLFQKNMNEISSDNLLCTHFIS
ncbi:MAG: hypothetical protein PHT94_01965 [Candidatus Nanoarchaeia archaeon]|nr:hypothetical protein [Candidatus Nanoarchaeia archaeon]